MFQEEMEDTFCVRFFLQFDDDTKAGPVRLITDFRHTFNLFIKSKFFHLLDEVRLVHFIRELGDGDLFTATFELLDLGLRPDDDLSFTGLKCFQDALFPHDRSSGREIRTCDILECVFRRINLAFQTRDSEIEHFGQVMRRNLRRITS